MRKAVVLTAHNRPNYLRSVLDTWTHVRGLDDWDFYISIDDDGSEDCAWVKDIANEFQQLKITDVYILQHSPKLGVLRHPYVVLDATIKGGYDFVLRAEDDLEVSTDILEYVSWAAEAFKHEPSVKTVHAYSARDHGEDSSVTISSTFNPWIFGTWADTWVDLKLNWDLDYSTYNERPGFESGFDWNFTSRVYPQNAWYGVYPEKSRVNNIGVYGVHGTPENFPTTPTYTPDNESLGGKFELQLR